MSPEKTASGDPRTYAIIGACMEVHRVLGPGFLEAVYQEALAMELAAKSIPFTREVPLPVFYKGSQLKCSYRADFLCFDAVVLETKAQELFCGNDQAQVINYLKATGYEIGLLVNFGATSLQYKRFIFTSHLHQSKEMGLANDCTTSE